MSINLTLILLFLLLPFNGEAQSIELRDIALNVVPVCKKVAPNSIQLVYKLSKNPQGDQDSNFKLFRLLRFDTLLNLQDTLLIRVSRYFEYLSFADISSFTYCLFDSPDGIQLLTYSKKERSQKIVRLNIKIKKQKNQLQFQSLVTSDGLYINKMIGKKHWELTKFDLSGKPLWLKIFIRIDKSFTQSVIPLSSSLLCLQIERHKRSTLLRTSIIDAPTGNELSVKDFLHQKENSTCDNIFIARDSSLFITGRRFTGHKPSLTQTGNPFILQYHPDGQPEELDFEFPSSLHKKFMWEDLAYDPDGNSYLIGETFTSGSLAGYISKCILALPLLLLETTTSSNSSLVDFTKIRFRDVVYLPLASDSLRYPRFLNLHKSTFRVNGFSHTYPLAQIAIDMRQSRYLLANQSGVFFKDSRQVRKLQLPNYRFMLTPQTVSRNSLFVSKNYFIDGSPSFLKGSYLLDIKKNESN